MTAPNPNSTPGAGPQSEWIGRRGVALLDLTWGGQTYRVATEAITVSSDDGDLPYEPGMNWPDYTEEIVTDGGQSASLEVYLPGDVDVAKRRQRGHDLLNATAELSLVTLRGHDHAAVVEQTWEGRLRLIAGQVVSPRYAHPEKAANWLSFGLERYAWNDQALLLETPGVVDATTWPSHNTAHTGKIYPLPIGTPGNYRASTSKAQVLAPGSPAYIVIDNAGTAEKLLIAGEAVDAGTVTVIDEAGAEQSFSVIWEVDGLGRLTATCDITTPGAIDATDTTFYVAFDGGGGLVNPFGTGALELAGDVVRWAFGRTSLLVDHARFAVQAQYLNRIKLATYIDDPEATPWDWLADNVLGLLPWVSILQGPEGLYPVVTDPEATTVDAVAVTEGPDFARVLPMSSDGSRTDVLHEFVLEFAQDVADGSFKRRRILTADWDSSDPEQTTSALVEISRRRYTEPDAPAQASSQTTDVLYDASSADVVLGDLSRFHGFIPEATAYEADLSYGHIRPGTLLSVTDSSASLTARLGYVSGRSLTPTSWLFTVRFDEDPGRDPHAST